MSRTTTHTARETTRQTARQTPVTDTTRPMTAVPQPGMVDRTTRCLRIIGNALLAAGTLLGLLATALMCYLSRGAYDPADVLALLVMCLCVAGCPPCLIAGGVVRVIAAVRRAARA